MKFKVGDGVIYTSYLGTFRAIVEIVDESRRQPYAIREVSSTGGLYDWGTASEFELELDPVHNSSLMKALRDEV